MANRTPCSLSNLFLFAILFAAHPVDADSPRDSLSKASPFLKLDSRHTFIGGLYAGIFGFKTGLEFSDRSLLPGTNESQAGRLRIGIGYYWLYRNSRAFDRNVEGLDQKIYDAKLTFNYLSILGEYLFYRRKKWEFSVPVQLGFGNAYYTYRDENGAGHRYGEGLIIIYEPVIEGYYRPVPWAGLGIGGGMRIALFNASGVEKKFNSPVYIAKAVVFVGEIIRGL